MSKLAYRQAGKWTRNFGGETCLPVFDPEVTKEVLTLGLSKPKVIYFVLKICPHTNQAGMGVDFLLEFCYCTPLVFLTDNRMPLTALMRVFVAKKGSLLLAGVFVAAASFFLVTLLAPRFQVTTDFMVVQASTPNQDFYTLFKSSEFLSRVLSESVMSERFINAVVATGHVSQEFLPTDKRDRLKAWRDMVTIEKNIELGMLTITVKADTDREAGKVMQAVSDVLLTKNVEFRGGDEKAVEIRILSGPISERNPSPKELVLIIATAFLAGFSLMALAVTFRALGASARTA